jgi:hypothetical protein
MESIHKLLKNIQTKQCVETGCVLVLAMIWWYSKSHWPWLLFAAAVSAIIIALVPVFFYPLAVFLYLLGRVLGKISSTIILTVIFFLLVTPVGLIRRLLKKDNLRLDEFKRNKNTVFAERQHLYLPADLDHPF